MSSYYRINVRFDLENEKERQVVEYLRQQEDSRNRVIVEAVIDHMEQGGNLLEAIRQVVREELQNVSFEVQSLQFENVPNNLSEEEQKQNAAGVLSALDDFF